MDNMNVMLTALEMVLNVLMVFAGRHLVLATYAIKCSVGTLAIATCGILMLVTGIVAIVSMGLPIILPCIKMADC